MTHERNNLLTRREAIGILAGITFAGKGFASSSQEQRLYTFAVLGIDTRESNPDKTDQRADTIMLSRVNLDALTVRTLSIPRDLYVEIPGYGANKINEAYHAGIAADPTLNWQSGAAKMVETITYNFGIVCDGMAVLELQRLPEVIDAVGGLEVINPYAIYVEEFNNFDHFTDGGTRVLEFPEGPITLDGAAAMDFVRTRQQDGDGGRVMRQQLVLVALLQKLQQPEMVPRIPELVDQLRDIVHTDIPLELELQLIAAVPQIPVENLAFTNIDVLLTPGTTAGGAWIYQADWATLPAYVEGWLAGTIN